MEVKAQDSVDALPLAVVERDLSSPYQLFEAFTEPSPRLHEIGISIAQGPTKSIAPEKILDTPHNRIAEVACARQEFLPDSACTSRTVVKAASADRHVS